MCPYPLRILQLLVLLNNKICFLDNSTLVLIVMNIYNQNKFYVIVKNDLDLNLLDEILY